MCYKGVIIILQGGCKRVRKRVIPLTIFISLICFLIPGSALGDVPEGETNSGSHMYQSELFMRRDTYDVYLSKHADSDYPDACVVIPVESFSSTDMDIKVLEDYEGKPGYSILTDEEGYIEWEFEVEQPGFYNIEITYFPVAGRGSAIEREVVINGESPFFSARHLTFSRVWKDDGPITQDNRGNDLRPRQVESPMWLNDYFKDYMGYYNEPYHFYFNEGKNTIKLISTKEPMVIGGIRLTQADEKITYKELKKQYESKGYKNANDFIKKIQGEDALLKSDPTLYAHNDRASRLTEPYHHSRIRLNSIAGHRWSLPGQWIIWELEVDETGLYKLAIKARQSMQRGLFTTRKLTINGEVPFAEAETIRVNYDDDWQMHVISDEEGEPCLFYFEEGKTYQIKLETTLGDMAEILRMAENSVYELNRVYRRILMITGSNPDINRDYQLETLLPDDIRILGEQSQILSYISKRLKEETGQRGDYIAVIERLSMQLDEMYRKPYTITTRFQQFRDNVGSLASWIFATREQPLEIDYIVVASPEMPVPRVKANFIEKIFHEIRSFFASFAEDYNAVGDFHEDDEAVTVWLGGVPGMGSGVGRDQAQVIKRLIDDTFVPSSGIPVNIKLIDLSALLPATLAGKGPDVALFIDEGLPVNYAMRNAVVDLTRFDDFEEIAQRFHPESFTPLQYDEGVYALPETRSFNMLFYRTDIFEELGLKVPQTWDDIEILIPELLKYNMEFGLFAGLTSMGSPMQTSLGTYAMFLYQQGGELYHEDGISTALDSGIAINTFRRYTEYYSLFKLPFTFNFQNRFRTGEMPAAIMDFQSFNLLTIFAPEIRGLFDFVPVPGTLKEDGTIDRTTVLAGTNCIILSPARDYEKAWEFIKWWTDAPVQVSFGHEMESLMGTAARYPTANMEALTRIPWPVHNINNLMDQYEHVKGIPQVPGGYYLPRHFDFAFRGVVYLNEDPRERLREAVRDINEEIRIKREEFGLRID